MSSAVMQMYLEHLLKSLLSLDSVLTAAAFDVVCVILEQGLVHPVLCLPYVIAMQTSDTVSVRERAFAIYEHLAEKHLTLIHTKNWECVKKTFEYQQAVVASKVAPGKCIWVSGYTMEKDNSVDDEGVMKPVAMLHKLYSKVQLKKNKRNEFLASLVRSFDFDTKMKKSKDMIDIAFARFIADNISVLDFKTIDEVYHVLYHISQLLSVSAEGCQKYFDDLNKGVAVDREILPLMAKGSIIMCILILLKAQLQSVYLVSDAQCRRYTPSDFAKTGEKNKPALRQAVSDVVINWTRIPFADNRQMETEAEMMEQSQLLIQMMDEFYYAGGPGDNADQDEEEAEKESEDEPFPSANSSPVKGAVAPKIRSNKSKDKKGSNSTRTTKKKASGDDKSARRSDVRQPASSKRKRKVVHMDESSEVDEDEEDWAP